MDTVTVESLLLADEEKLRSELAADTVIDNDRTLSAERLRGTFGDVLLRYNAAASADRPRQALADCLTAVVSDMLGLLQAGTVRRDGKKPAVRMSAVVLLMLGVILALSAALLYARFFVPSIILAALCPVCVFISGRIWHTKAEEQVSAGLDAELVWRTVRRTGETMDRKIDGFCQQLKGWEEECAANTTSDLPLSEEELSLFADLLEGLYSENGDYALRQLVKLRPYLRRRGVEIRDYDETDPAAFELLPTRKDTRTVRPAIYAGDKLLLPGRAVEHTDEAR